MSDALPMPGAKYAWRELPHKGPPKRSARERVADFLEIYGPYDQDTAREQASRCIQCADPMCVEGCPLGNHIPEWMLLTAEGQFLEAAAILHAASAMPDICTRICPTDQLCEKMCILNGKTEPVSIGAIEQFLYEYAFAHDAIPPTAAPNGLTVAIVGSGPCGLTCADELSRRGYAVTVFDSELLPGGLLVNGVPAFKLEKAVVQRRIDLLKQRGVVFELGATLGENIALQQLRDRFDAVFLGFDARQARALHVPGADLTGVVQALPFIVQKNSHLPSSPPLMDVSGQTVVVLGAGDTAMDCLRTALRAGAREALCVYRRDEASMPCSPREYQNALEEGAHFLFQAAPVAFLGSARLSTLRLIRTEPAETDPSGRREFQARPGSEFEIPADWVVLALGFNPAPLPDTGDFKSSETNPSGGLRVDDNQMTTFPGVFAAGDIVRGPSLLLHAVRDARRAALAIHTFLSSRSGLSAESR